RLDPGRGERGRGRAAAVRDQRRADAVHAGADLEGPAGARAGRSAAMIPAQFDYVRPGSVAEACEVLAGDEDAKVLAGGQSLLPLLRLRLAYPSTLVDVGRLDELKGVHDRGDHVYIGALTTHD